MNIVFIGSVVSKEESMQDVRISQAGNNYQLKFISILKPVLSLSLYPVFLRNKVISNNNLFVTINNQIFFNARINKLYRLVFDTIEGLSIIRKLKIKDVFIYNIDRQNAILVWAIKFVLKKNVYIILADYSTNQKNTIYEKIIDRLVSKLNGVLTLNSNILVNRNQINSPGLLELECIKFNVTKTLNRNVLFSGSLGLTTGLMVTLETFSNNSKFDLFITGRPYHIDTENFESLLYSYTSKYDNIHYLGLLEFEEYLEVLKKCDIALSLRNPLDLEHQYNFPSKILEYLANSKVVISTLSYENLPKDFLFITKFDPISLSDTLDFVHLIDFNSRLQLMKSIYDYSIENLTETSIIRNCKNLISNNND